MSRELTEKAYIITFRNSTDAMLMKTAALGAGMPGTLIPTPRSLTASCGFSWGAPADAAAALARFLAANQIQHEKTVVMTYSGGL